MKWSARRLNRASPSRPRPEQRFGSPKPQFGPGGGSRRSVLRALLITALTLVAIATQATSVKAESCGSSAEGYVRDPFGRAIPGARVYAPFCQDESITDSQGRYKVNINGLLGGSDEATASKQGFVSQTKTIYAGYQAIGKDNNFTLYFDLSASLSPSAIKSGQSLLIEASTTAPPPGGLLESGSRTIAQLPNGLRKNLNQGATDASGWTYWSGSYTPPAGDGTYTIKVCAVDKGYASGNCDQAAALSPPKVVTPIRSLSYTVDDTPPSLIGRTPSPGRDWLDRRPTVEVLVSDGNGSGVNAASLTLRLDGALVAASYSSSSGVLSFQPSNNLALGLHTVTATASDVLGNASAPYSFTFDTVQLAATSATASIPAVTVQVNPSGSVVPPNKVTFVAPPLRRGSFQVTLTSSLEVGYGTVDSVPNLSSAAVEFNNETGIPKTVSAGLSSATIPDLVANLASTRDVIGVTIAERTAALPNLTVNVPAGYGTRGSTATLRMNAVSFTPRPHATGAALGSNIPDQPWEIRGWHLMGLAVQTGGGTDISAGTYPIVRMGCAPGENCPVVIEPSVLGSAQVPQPYGQDLPPDLDPAGSPGTVNGCAAGYTCVEVNGTQPTSTFWSVPGMIASAGYHRLYSIAPSGGSPSRYVAWQQSYIDLNPVSCGELLLETFGNTTRSLTSAWAPSLASPGLAATSGSSGQEFTDDDPGPAAWDRNYFAGSPLTSRGKEIVYLGRPEYRIGSRAYLAGNPDAAVEPQLLQQPDGVFVLSGDFTGATGSRIDELGQIVSESRGSYNLWTPATSGYDRSAVVHTGTEYVGSTSSYTFESALAFRILLDTTAC